MTGYGRGESVLHDRTITVELRAVNNRYLDCSVKIPRLYVFAEETIKSQVQKKVARGKLDVFVTIDSTAADKVAVSLNRPVADGYYAALTQLRDTYDLRDDISVSLLSRFPDVFLVEKEQGDADVIAQDISQVLDLALEDFNAMRAREGAKLAEDVRSKAGNIAALLAQVEERSPKPWPSTGKSSASGWRRFWPTPSWTRAASSPRRPSLPTRWRWTRKPSACTATWSSWRTCWPRGAPSAGSWTF